MRVYTYIQCENTVATVCRAVQITFIPLISRSRKRQILYCSALLDFSLSHLVAGKYMLHRSPTSTASWQKMPQKRSERNNLLINLWLPRERGSNLSPNPQCYKTHALNKQTWFRDLALKVKTYSEHSKYFREFSLLQIEFSTTGKIGTSLTLERYILLYLARWINRVNTVISQLSPTLPDKPSLSNKPLFWNEKYINSPPPLFSKPPPPQLRINN